jgi:hypothetical protein
VSAERRIVENPLLVLGLGAGVSRMEIERQAQLLLGMIELGFADALTYPTPLGPRPRTADGVRAAVAALRDPTQRLIAELWLAPVAPAEAAAAPTTPATTPAGDAWPDARMALGWAPRVPPRRPPRGGTP